MFWPLTRAFQDRQRMDSIPEFPIGLRATCATFALLTPLAAVAQQLGDWVVEKNRELVVATTRNSSDSVLGYSCSRTSSACAFFYMPDKLKCKDGARYALLVNGGSESTSRGTTCKRLDWQEGHEFANILDGSEALRKQMLSATEATIGIARGTGTDGFSVSKFSMRGFRAAFDKVAVLRDDRSQLRDYNTDKTGGSGIEFELYEHDNYQGRRLNGRADIARLSDLGFNDIVSSIVVHRGRWEACTDAYYRGNCLVYGPGRYPDVAGYNDKFSSVRRVN
jgi:hypothetical protein